MTKDVFTMVQHPSYQGSFVVRVATVRGLEINNLTADQFHHLVTQEAHEYLRSFQGAKPLLGLDDKS